MVTSAVNVETLVQQRESLEAQFHVKFQQWCNSTLPPQSNRRDALRHLLTQEQLTQNPPLKSLDQESEDLGDALAQRRISSQAQQSMYKRHLSAAQLFANDAVQDVRALQGAMDRLKQASGGGPQVTNKIAFIDKLLQKAKAAAAYEQKKHTQLLQMKTESSAEHEIAEMEKNYSKKKAQIAQIQHQFFTTARSLDVLASALEDESAYFSNLQALCGVESAVYERLRKNIFPSLHQAVHHQSSAPQKDDQEAKEVMKQESDQSSPPASSLASALEAMPAAPVVQEASMQKEQSQPTAEPGNDDHLADQDVSNAAPQTLSSQAISSDNEAQSAPAGQTEHSAPKGHETASAENTEAATVVNKGANHKLRGHHKMYSKQYGSQKHSAQHVKKTVSKPKLRTTATAQPVAAAVAAEDASDDDDDVDAELPPKGAPKAKTQAAISTTPAGDADASVASEAVASSSAQMHAHKAASKLVHKATTTVQSIVGDGDDDGMSEPVTSAPVKTHAKHLSSKSVSKAKHQATTTVQPLLADDTDEDASQLTSASIHSEVESKTPTTAAKEPSAEGTGADTSSDESMDLPPPKPTVHKVHKKSKSKANFMDGVYNSAVGNMPQEYVAWEPAGASHSHRKSRAAGSATEDPTKRMMAMFGDDTTMPKPTTPLASSKSSAKKGSFGEQSARQDAESRQGAGHSNTDSDDLETDVASAKTSKSTSTDSSKLATTSDADDGLKPDVGASKVSTVATSDNSDSKSNTLTSKPLSHLKKAAAFNAKTASDDAESNSDSDDAKLDALLEKQAPPKKAAVVVATKSTDIATESDDAAVQSPAQLSPSSSSMSSDDFDRPESSKTPSATQNPAKRSKPEAGDVSFNQMIADFENDDDDEDAPKPRQHAKAAPAKEARAPKKTEEVVYDDDDLPKHHRRPISAELRGGWQQFLKKGGPSKARKPQVDPDVAIMQSLYTKDGALPSQYSAWTPASAESHASLKQPAPAAASSDAASSDASNGDDDAFFTQVSSVIHHHAKKSVVVYSNEGSDDGLAARDAVLQQYAEVLHSTQLQMLSHAHLSPEKLATLSKRLQTVDPLRSANAASSKNKQVQAEQWCSYFEQNEQTAAPVHQAIAHVEKANSELAEATSQRAALAEEVDARTQLQKTVERDVTSVMSLLTLARKGEDTTTMDSTKLSSSEGKDTVHAVGVASGLLKSMHEELEDLLQTTLRERRAVLTAHKTNLEKLHKAQRLANANVARKQSQVAEAQAVMKAAQQKLAGIQRSCDATMNALAQQRHAAHMEAHAIEMALDVFHGGPSP